MSAVRLWWVPGYRPMLDLWTKDPHPEGDGEDDAVAYLALPAAEHAALVALLKKARTALAEALMVVGTLDADRAAYGASLLKQVDLARDLGLPTMESLDAALAGLGEAGKSPEVRS